MQEQPHEPHYEGCAFHECPTPPEFIIYEVGKSDVSHSHVCGAHAVKVLRTFIVPGVDALVGKHEPERSN